MNTYSTAQLRRIRCMIFDIDGVFTDGRLYYASDGEQLKTFHTLDGQGIRFLIQAGITCAVITGRSEQLIAKRVQEFGIRHLYCSSKNKIEDFAHLLSTIHVNADDCGYMGDDWPDLAVMQTVSFAACPPNAHVEILTRSHYVTQAQAGAGAVREIADLILRAQGHYERLLSTYCVSG